MNIEKLVKRTAIATVLLCIAGSVSAQTATRVTPCDAATPNNALCLTWTHDGKNTAGQPVTGVTYRVEQKFGTGAFTQVAGPLTAKQYYAQNRAPGTYVFMVFANCGDVGCVESNGSNQATKDATAIPSQPSAPVLIIAATINANGPPTYKVIQSYTLKANEVVFVAPAALKPLFAAR